MKWYDSLFFIVLVSPAAALLFFPFVRKFVAPTLKAFHLGVAVSAVRLVAGAILANALFHGRAAFQLKINLVSDARMSGLFEADVRRVLFIAVSEMVFLFVHYFVDPAKVDSPERRITSALAVLLQLLLPLMVFSSNLFFVCTAELLLVITGFFAVRWFSYTRKDHESAGAAETMLFRYALLAILLLAWGIAQLGFDGLSLSLIVENHVVPTTLLSWLWIVCFVVALPILPWSRWYRVLFDRDNDAVAMFAVLIAASAVFKVVEFGSLTYQSLVFKQAVFLYCLGLFGVFFSISEFFSSEKLRLSLTALSRFFFSAVALSLGLAPSGSPSGAMLITTFVVGYMALALFVSSAISSNRFVTIITIWFLGFLFGVPGSPVYFLYAFVGARSFAGGLELSVLFGLVWALYFFSVVHLSRIMLPAARPAPFGSAGPDASVNLRMAYSAFVLLSLSVVCWIFGGRA